MHANCKLRVQLTTLRLQGYIFWLRAARHEASAIKTHGHASTCCYRPVIRLRPHGIGTCLRKPEIIHRRTTVCEIEPTLPIAYGNAVEIPSYMVLAVGIRAGLGVLQESGRF